VAISAAFPLEVARHVVLGFYFEDGSVGIAHRRTKFQEIEQSVAELLMIQHIFPAYISRGDPVASLGGVRGRWWTKAEGVPSRVTPFRGWHPNYV